MGNLSSALCNRDELNGGCHPRPRLSDEQKWRDKQLKRSMTRYETQKRKRERRQNRQASKLLREVIEVDERRGKKKEMGEMGSFGELKSRAF